MEYFIKNDEMPSRTDAKGNSRRLSPKDLAPLIGDVLSAGKSTKLIGFIDKSWSALCGMVHAGMHLVTTYSNAEIGFHLEPKELVEILGNTLSLAQLSMVGISAVSKADKQQLSDIFQHAHQAQKAFHMHVEAEFPR